MIENLSGPLKNPTVTVLIAVYNAEKYIAEGIESILSQTYQDVEIVIVNDGSTDNSVQIVQNFTDNRIRIFSQANAGPASARRLGTIKACGKYIAILDADDIALPNRLEKQIEYMEKHPALGGLGCEAIYISADGKEIGKTKNYRPVEVFAEKLAAKETGFLNPTFMYLRDAVLVVGNFDDRFPQGEDIDLLLRISERYEIAILDQYLVKVRRQPQSYSHRASDETQVQWWYGALAAVNHYLRKAGLPDLFSPGQEKKLKQFQENFLSSIYHRRRFARQQVHFGNMAWNAGKLIYSLNRYLAAFRIDPFWWRGSQATMLQELMEPFVTCSDNRHGN